MVLRALKILLTLAAVAAIACTGARDLRVVTFPQECEVVSAPRHPADTITVVDQSGPPINTLIRVDCLGDVRPGIATSWERHDGGRRWRFDVDNNTRTRLTRAWRRNGVAFDAGIDSAVFDNGQTNIYFSRKHRSVPRVLSHSELGIPAVRVPEHRGRIGYVAAGDDNALDLLEGSVDVLVTSDPSVVEYASTRPDLVTSPLPWAREYVLLSTTRVESLRRGEPVGAIPVGLLERLATDAVRGDARGSDQPCWWDDYGRNCDDLADAAPWSPSRPAALNDPGPRLIVYEKGDPVARGLAERIVALAAAESGSSLDAGVIAAAVPGIGDGDAGFAARAVSVNEMRESLKHGDDFAYVVALPHRPADVCFEIRRLIDRARWLLHVENQLTDALIPLVVTRQHVIARRDRAGVSVDWYGNVHVQRERP